MVVAGEAVRSYPALHRRRDLFEKTNAKVPVQTIN
jgi:hypothetical protein